MVDPLSRRMVPTSLAEPAGYRISRNIRRPRHIRDASTAQAHSPKSSTQGICKTINQQCIETQRAGTAARPYAEILPSKVRDSVGQPNGTYAIQPPRKRIHQSRARPRSSTPAICKSSNHPHIETRGRAQRPAPTQRFFLDPTLPVIQYRQSSQQTPLIQDHYSLPNTA